MLLLFTAGSTSLLGGTGRPSDGLLFSLVVLSFLGAILGIIHLVEYIPVLIEKIIMKFLGDINPSNGDLF